jgi:hypothetical protein
VGLQAGEENMILKYEVMKRNQWRVREAVVAVGRITKQRAKFRFELYRGRDFQNLASYDSVCRFVAELNQG